MMVDHGLMLVFSIGANPSQKYASHLNQSHPFCMVTTPPQKKKTLLVIKHAIENAKMDENEKLDDGKHHGKTAMSSGDWLVVEHTPLKNMKVS